MLKTDTIFFLKLEKGNSSNLFVVCTGFTSISIDQLTDTSIRSVNTIYLKVRQRIAQCCELESPLQGYVGIDESYFGAQRVRGNRSLGAIGKTIVFGVLKRQGKVYVEIVPDRSKAALHTIIYGHVAPDTVIDFDACRGSITDWSISALTGTSGFIMVTMNLQVMSGILTASNLSGVLQKDVWQNSMTYLYILSTCTCKKLNFVLIISVIISTLKF